MRKTAKKLFAVVLAALMLSAVTAVPVSAETPEEECWFHVWEQGDVITPASEGDLGEAVLKCANCGAERTVGIGKKVRGVSIEVLRPLNTELDQRAGRGNDLYEITNVLGKVRLTFEDGSVCRLSYSDLINIYSYDTFEIIDNGLPENPVPGEYTFRFTFLNREYAQRYKVNDTRYVSVSFRDDAPLTMCMTDAEQHVTDVPISFVRETEYSLCVYSLWYSGQPFLYFENAGTQSQPVYTFNGVTAVSPENCAWFKQLKAAEDALVPFTTSMSGGMQKTDVSRIEYNGVFTAQNLDAVIENVIVDYRDRPEGSESKLSTYSDGFKVLRTIARLFRNYKPGAFYGAIAAVLLVIALLFFIPILVEYVRTGLVPRFPTLIACGFVVIAAIQAFFAGQMLETIGHKNRQDFELELIRARKEQERLR